MTRWTAPQNKNGTVGLRQIADKMWDRSLTGWQFNTNQLCRWWDISEDQAKKVKHYMRKRGAKEGVLWGWRPSCQRFAVAPHNRPDIAAEIIGYARKHWRDAGKDYHLTLESAYGQGYISKDDRDEGAALYGEFDRRIAEVNTPSPVAAMMRTW